MALLELIAKAIGAGAIIATIVGIAAWEVAMHGSCATAASVADLAPNLTFLTLDQIAHAIMSARSKECAPTMNAKVVRYCHDLPYAGFMAYEEAMEISVSLDTHGLSLSDLELHITPGVVSGPDTPHKEMLDETADPLERVGFSAVSGVARWQVDYQLKKGRKILRSATDKPLQIHYYALDSRGVGKYPPITCKDNSQLTTIAYSASAESGLVVPDAVMPVATSVMSWSRVVSDPERRAVFSGDKRITATSVVHREAEELAARNDQTGWRYFPPTYPDLSTDYPASCFDSCDPKVGSCRFDPLFTPAAECHADSNRGVK